MRLTKTRLKQIIKEELDEIEDYDDFSALGPQEENQEPVITANEALHSALQAVEDLETITEFNMDASITLADLDYKIVKINRAWKRIQGD
jgi:hypothetical protein